MIGSMPWTKIFLPELFCVPVESFSLTTPWIINCQTSCLWFRWICLWASCWLSEASQTVWRDRNHKELLDGINQRGTPTLYGPLSFNIFFINNLFLFIENCTLYNYADDNSMSYPSTTLKKMLCQTYTLIVKLLPFGSMKIAWKPTQTNFNWWFCHRMPQLTLNSNCKLGRNTTLISETCVKALGVTINCQLAFNDPIRVCCLKAAWHLNAEFPNILIQI